MAKKRAHFVDRRNAAMKKVLDTVPAHVSQGWVEYVFIRAWNMGHSDGKRHPAKKRGQA